MLFRSRCHSGRGGILSPLATLPAAHPPMTPSWGRRFFGSSCAAALFSLFTISSLASEPISTCPGKEYWTVTRGLQADNQFLVDRWSSLNGRHVFELYASKGGKTTAIRVDSNLCTKILNRGGRLARYYPFDGT